MPINIIASVQQLLETLAPTLMPFAKEHIILLYGVAIGDDVRKIEQTLRETSAVLIHAQELQLTDPLVRLWLDKLKAVVYDIEDLLDVISTEALESEGSGISLAGRCFRKLRTDYVVGRKIKEIRERMDDIERNNRPSNLRVQHIVPLSIGERRSYPSVYESRVFGRKPDTERIIDHLVRSSIGDDDIGRVSVAITGIGGMGKTTVAKLIFSDPDIERRFPLRIWATGSSRFNLKTLIIDILLSATGKDFSHLNERMLHNKLARKLRGKTYFLILDDFKMNDIQDWIDLKCLLELGSPESRILVTTREERVACITGTRYNYHLEGLPYDDCWSLFASFAFSTRGDEEKYPGLVMIGKSIAQKCKGVPLLARTFGSVLNENRVESTWKRMEEIDLHKMISQDGKDIMSCLKLSYDRVSYHLQVCFAACAVLKRGQPLFRTDVIHMWMALGLLPCREDENVEDVGGNYFNKLLSSSFLQSPGYDVAKKVITGYGKVFDESSFWVDLAQMFESDWKNNLNLVVDTFFQPVQELFFVEMHELMHDLATYVSGDDIAVVTIDGQEIPARALHILWNQLGLSNPTWTHSVERRARSFAFVHPVASLSKSFVKGLTASLKYLRILDLSFCELEELPESIGDLKHLRLLKLCWNLNLVGLPDSVSKLVNLQTLDLFRCIELAKLPFDIEKLVSLRFLSLTTTLESLPDGLFKLRSLRVLRLAFCNRLRFLSQGIGNLKYIRQLEIICCDSIESLPNEMRDLVCLEQLSVFCCRKLDLYGWEGLYGLKGLKYLDLKELPQWQAFPLGLQSASSLQHLRVQKCEQLTTLGEGLNGCTSLLKLNLSGCPRLTQIPRSIRNLKFMQQLIIDECPEVAKSCVKGGIDWCRISHIREIIINRQIIEK